MLLSMVSLTINSMIIDKTTAMLDAEASLNAISIAQSMLDEVQSKSYDLATVSAKVYKASDFTATSSLGPNATETNNVPQPDTTTPFRSVKYYNDVDDYQNYKRTVKTDRMNKFTVVDTVFYVVETNTDQKATTQTFHKKIVVTVRHPNMLRPLQLSDVAVYRRYF